MKLKSRLLTGFVGVACMSLIVGSLALRNMGVTTKVIELEKSASLAKESEAVDLSIGGAREKANALESAIQDATDRKDRNAQALAETDAVGGN